METLIFLGFAFVAIVSGIGVVFSRNAVYSALLLVANFFCLAAFYVMLNAQFLAAVQVTVYAGAIMVLFVFVTMLLSPSADQRSHSEVRWHRWLVVPLALVFIGQIVVSIVAGSVSALRGPYDLEGINAVGGSVQAVGRVLFTDYLLPFEVVSLLLIVALVGAVFLGKRKI